MSVTVSKDGVVTFRCAQCGLPWARIQSGALIVQSRHHGDSHINAVAVEELLKLSEQQHELEIALLKSGDGVRNVR